MKSFKLTIKAVYKELWQGREFAWGTKKRAGGAGEMKIEDFLDWYRENTARYIEAAMFSIY